MVQRRRWLVHGRVQGVLFRHSTHTEAERIGSLEGFVRNLPDGTVEVEAKGSSADLETLLAFLGQGPPTARVDRVEEVAAASGEELEGFRVL